MSKFYNFNGRRHEIADSEIYEIERSGASHHHRDYADGFHSPIFFSFTKESIDLALSLMHGRPWQTEAQPEVRSRALTRSDIAFIRNMRPYCAMRELAVAMGISYPTIVAACVDMPRNKESDVIEPPALREAYRIHRQL